MPEKEKIMPRVTCALLSCAFLIASVVLACAAIGTRNADAIHRVNDESAAVDHQIRAIHRGASDETVATMQQTDTIEQIAKRQETSQTVMLYNLAAAACGIGGIIGLARACAGGRKS
jgi:hypothetical protein